MSRRSEIVERLASKVRFQAIDRVASGSPVSLLLTMSTGNVNTPRIAHIRARRHVALKSAHAALTQMLETGQCIIDAPMVEDVPTLLQDLRTAGAVATLFPPYPDAKQNDEPDNGSAGPMR